MATQTGKQARKAHGNRFSCKRAKSRRRRKRGGFGKLPVSESRGNAKAWREGGIEDPIADQGSRISSEFRTAA